MADIIPKNSSPEELNRKLKLTIKNIDKELKTLGNLGDSNSYKISNPGSFKYNELDSNTVNIHTCASPEYLGKSLGMMLRVQRDYKEAMEFCNLIEYPACTWCGNYVEDWINDLQIRLKYVLNSRRIGELTRAKEELTTFLSTEDRLHSTLERLSKSLKK